MQRLATVLLALLLCAGAATGQIGCFGDDGFDTGCCNQPAPSLPAFPPFNTFGAYACSHACGPGSGLSVDVFLSPPQMVLCDYALIQLNVVSTSATAPNFSGTLIAKYARTWLEQAGPGSQRQVWRFLLNGDLSFQVLTSSSSPCPLPPCSQAPLGLPVHVTGSIDYAASCSTSLPTNWSIALQLTHPEGCFSHAGFSQRPLNGPRAHVDTSYALVAPGNFQFGVVQEPEGPIVADALRSSLLDPAQGVYACRGEGRVTSGSLTTLGEGCSPCVPILPPPPPPLPWKHQSLVGVAACGPPTVVTPVQSVPIPGILPTGLAGKTLGTWVGINASLFPVGRSVVNYLGVVQGPDPCDPNAATLHLVSGVGHTGGAPAVLFQPLPLAGSLFEFLDLQNMLILGPSPVPTPGIGAAFVSTMLWSINTN